jgi:cytosine/adenosine deaminase-related metal-dependent hydrolase
MDEHDDTATAPVACTLDAPSAERQLGDWAALGRSWRRTEDVEDGARLWFDAGAEAALRAVAEREAACCRFLRLEVGTDAGLVRLDLTSPQPEGRPVIEALVREASGRGGGPSSVG